MLYEIKHRHTDKVLYSAEGDSLAEVLTKAVREGADLKGADLKDADLTDADLWGANLEGANLKDANLYRADLWGANLKDADLYGANLTGAYLKDANLTYAYLAGANLKGTILSKANLDAIQVDYYDVLSRAPDEVPALLQALRDGKIEGSTYEGECACLVGTIAKVRKVSYTDMETLKPDSSRLAERWFLAIKKGDTPKTNPVAALVETWTEEWVRSNE